MRFLVFLFVVYATIAQGGASREVTFIEEGLFKNNRAEFNKRNQIYSVIRGSRHGECTGYLFDYKKGEEFVVPQPRRCSDVDLCNLILERPASYTYKNSWTQGKQYLGRSGGRRLSMATWIKEANRRGFTPDSCLDMLVTKFKAAGGKLPSNKATAKQSSKPANQVTLLEQSFRKLSANERKEIQATLKELRFYNASIDGLYGKGTAAALNEYNKQYFSNANLKNRSL